MLCLSGFELYSRWVPLNYAKNYASTFYQSHQINKQINWWEQCFFLSFEMFVNKNETSSEPEDTALRLAVG